MDNLQCNNSEHAPVGSKVPDYWNDTTIYYPGNKTLHQLFEEQVEKTPDSIALVFKDDRISYHELNCHANQLAYVLVQNGAGRESLVGVCAERSFEMVIALLAILKAGGAYVPVDPEYPDERREFMIRDSNLKLVITHPETEKKCPANVKNITYHKDDLYFKSQPGRNFTSGAGPGNAVYAIYTSGSTGTPKGVINIHAGIVNRLLWMQDCFKMTDGDCVMQKTPFTFDVSVWEFFWPLVTGARLVIAEPGRHGDADYLLDTIQQYSISTLHFVPSMLRLFLDSEKLTAVPSLKRVICSGEALPYSLQERFFSKLQCGLYNLYGPTEAAVDVTWWECRRNDQRHIVPIGKPIANIQIYILDEHMECVPVGTPGELYIGGVGVARGYINRPELTSERFIPNPFSGKSNENLYKTGDLCRYLEDGAIEYLGRIDDQIKVHGFRIEPGEIEAAILGFRQTRAAAVKALHDSVSGDTRIIAYLVTDLKCIPVSELRAFLLSKIPEYMVPAQFVKIPDMPLSHNGKVNKKILPQPPATRPQLLQEFVGPSSEIEFTIAHIWSVHLKIDPIGVYDNFFDIGGNSIIAAIITDSLEVALKKTIPVVTVFQYPTIKGLGEYLTAGGENNSSKDDASSRVAKQKNMLRNQSWLRKKP